MTTENTQEQSPINLKLFGGLSSYRPGNPACYSIVPDMTLLELIRQLSIPSSTAVTAFVNGKNVALDYHLQGNEEVKIFPLMGGG